MSSSSASIYALNFRDSRIRNSIKKSLTWALLNFSDDEIMSIPSITLTDQIGQMQRASSRAIRDEIFTVVDSYFSRSKNVCRRYRLNHSGIQRLYAGISPYEHFPAPDDLRINVLRARHHHELMTLDFVYDRKSERLFHPIQNVKRTLRDKLLGDSGMKFKYDIDACAQTLLIQHARNLPTIYKEYSRKVSHRKVLQSPLTSETPAIDYYLANKKSVRDRIARECDLDVETTKTILNSLFFGAKLSAGANWTLPNAIFNSVGCDKSKQEWLLQDQFISDLRKDIRLMWNHIRPTVPREMTTFKSGKRAGQVRIESWSGKPMSRAYRILETQVMDTICEQLDQQGIKYFRVHDGFYSSDRLDKDAICASVKSKTDFVISLSEELVK